jgi:hypothetical protein
MHDPHQHEPDRGNETKSKTPWVFLAFAAIAAFLLIIEHRTHIAGWLSAYGIWLLLLACPLLHVFMHGGHGHGRHQRHGKGDNHE